ncbi:FMN-dependent NADH-azoreductase [Paenibacillus silvae]|uniref:FMN-dependent NADH-azoreductase n=1 Tax=Paenibacillus silvae TaxID=1325358 RepID=UPI0025A14423|nr:FMN-dependent NADH-azoreductase [Paenibacillus silvae]MDM5277354.1 FMN-dependent NADH-azoreductase [Paenibacillus silvae]
MSTLLYITAHPHDHQTSFSMAAGKAFIEAYKQSHASDEIIHLDLYRSNIPHIDADVFSGWGKLQAGGDLTSEEQAKVQRLNELSDQFASADKYVFVTPLWNFSFPPVLKAYIDSICVAGKTFRYTEQGPIGLLTDKKALHIQARGGVYSEGPAAEMESGHRYLSIIMSFLGVPKLDGIFVEGHNQYKDRAEEIKQKGIEEAQHFAKQF